MGGHVVNGIGMKKAGRRDWNEAWDKVRDEGACRICGDTANLDPAHVIHRSQGGGMGADSIVPLCRADHHAFDSGELDLLPHLTEAEQLEAVRTVGLARAYRMLTNEDRSGKPCPW